MTSAKEIAIKTSQDNCKVLRDYWNKLRAYTIPFTCPLCSDIVLFENFEAHCTLLHNLNSKHCCVWCLGKVSWPGKQKLKHMDHVEVCWKKFMDSLRLPPPQTSSRPKPDPVPFDMTPMDPAQSLFDHVFDPPPRAYESVCPVPLPPNPLTFSHDSLNQAVSCIRLYLESGSTTEWFHVMVRTLAFTPFLQALDADQGRTQTLPFSCWCNGGEPTEARLRQHRHLIVVSSPLGHFMKNVWKSILPEDRPRKNFRCLHSERIVSPMHLVNTIGYLCKRTSRCNFSGYTQHVPEKQNHFYLFQSLPKDYRLLLVMQWDSGLLQLLKQTFKNLKPGDLVRALSEVVEFKHRFQIQHIPGITLGTVLPVSKEFQPCSRSTDCVLHLIGDRKMYFERNPKLGQLTREAWLRKQADMDNLFYYAVGKEHWTPRPYHQGLLREFKPLVDRNHKLKVENTQLQEKHESLKRHTALVEEDLAQFKKRYESSEQENKSLLKKINALNEGEIARLNEEKAELKRKLETLTKENEELKKRIKKPRVLSTDPL